jgi:hypothetical protein
MLPMPPIMSTETWASCAEVRQIVAPKMIDANRNRFIMHQIISGTSRPDAKLSRKSTDWAIKLEECRNDTCKLWGTIEGSSTGCSITTKLGCCVTKDAPPF